MLTNNTTTRNQTVLVHSLVVLAAGRLDVGTLGRPVLAHQFFLFQCLQLFVQLIL